MIMLVCTILNLRRTAEIRAKKVKENQMGDERKQCKKTHRSQPWNSQAVVPVRHAGLPWEWGVGLRVW